MLAPPFPLEEGVVARFITELKRTHSCGALTQADVERLRFDEGVTTLHAYNNIKQYLDGEFQVYKSAGWDGKARRLILRLEAGEAVLDSRAFRHPTEKSSRSFPLKHSARELHEGFMYVVFRNCGGDSIDVCDGHARTGCKMGNSAYRADHT